MTSPERGGIIEGYKKLNKITLTGALGVAFAGAFFAPAIVWPALTLAAIDGAQIVGINKYQNWRERGKSMKPGKAMRLSPQPA